MTNILHISCRGYDKGGLRQRLLLYSTATLTNDIYTKLILNTSFKLTAIQPS